MSIYYVTDLCFTYPSQQVPANQDISFQVEAGEVFALLGPNGAGKTTLLKQMLNLLTPTQGSIELLDQPVGLSSDYAARHVSYMPQSGEALNHLHVAEILYFTAHLRGLSRADARRERDRLIDALDLGRIRNRPAIRLSGGQRRLVLLAIALAANRPVLVLDEPTNDLDPQKRRLVWDLLRDTRRRTGTTILLVTHNIVEAEPIIDRLGIIQHGRLLTVGRLGELKVQLRHQLKLELRFHPAHPPQLPADCAIIRAELDRIQMLVPQERAAPLVDALLQQTQIEDFVLRTPTLEDLYLDTVNGG